MANYNFEISDQKPTDEEIKATKDFRRLKHKYQQAVKPLPKTRLDKIKNKRVFFIVLLVLLVLMMIYLSEKENNNDQPAPTTIEQPKPDQSGNNQEP